MIRSASAFDVPRLVEMGCAFLRQTPYGALIAENPAQLSALALQLVSNDAASAILVAEQAGALVGMIGLVAAPHFLSGEVTAGEVMWWVEPEARGLTGAKLIAAAEAWATEKGAKWLQMIAPDDKVAHFYERRGYRPLEQSYVRVLDA